MNNEKYGSTAPLRATLGTLRAGSPFRVLPQPSLEGMSALSTPSVSRTQPHGWGPKSQTQKKGILKIQNWKIKTPDSKIQTPKSKTIIQNLNSKIQIQIPNFTFVVTVVTCLFKESSGMTSHFQKYHPRGKIWCFKNGLWWVVNHPHFIVEIPRGIKIPRLQKILPSTLADCKVHKIY